MRVAITGHRSLTPRSLPLVRHAIKHELARFDPVTLTGISCLADGTDQLFAEIVLAVGGRLEVILVGPEHRGATNASFEDSLARAAQVRDIVATARALAWTAAAEELLRDADLLLAVWDGSPAAAPGSTADVVAAAKIREIPVVAVWPAGALRIA